ncbi:MAG: RHS repeat-associated core domain-containing protein, partial [Bacteroidota bacterium]
MGEHPRDYDAWGRPRNPVTLNYTAANPFTHSLNTAIITSRGYTFHEHIFEFSLINMNARMYDPVTRRVISPDNYIQAPDNTQSFNRYSYCFNSPLKYTDPSGDIVVESIIMAAMIGGMINATSQSMSGNINSTMDFMKAFGIGALAGAGGAFVGGAVAASVGVGGFVGGAAAGAAGGATGGFIGGAGNSWIQGGSFKDGIYSGLIGAGIGAAGGAIVGGAVGGIKSSINGKTFWDGRYTKTYLKENGITLTGKSISESELDDFINSNFKN